MLTILNIVLPTFIVIFIGFMIGKLTKLDFTAVVDVAIYIGIPALVFVSILGKEIVLLDAAKIWGAAIVIMLGCWLVARLVFAALRQKHTGLYSAIMFMNVVNIPFPIIYLAYGAEGLFAATLFYIPNSILIWTLGVFLVAGKHWKDNISEAFKLPSIYAALLALLLNFLDVQVPTMIFRSLDLVALMGIPLVLLVLGYNLSRVSITSLPTTLLASLLRVGVGLAMGFLVVDLFNVTGIARAVVILDSAMPSAVITSILATRYRSEADLVSSVVFTTTIISLVAIPFLLNVLVV